MVVALLDDFGRGSDGWFPRWEPFRVRQVHDLAAFDALVRDAVIRNWCGHVAWTLRGLRLVRGEANAQRELRRAANLLRVFQDHYTTHYGAEVEIQALVARLRETEPVPTGTALVEIQRTVVMLQPSVTGLTIGRMEGGTNRPLSVSFPIEILRLRPEHLISDDDLPGDYRPPPAPALAAPSHPNEAARVVLAYLYGVYLEKGCLTWSIEPDEGDTLDGMTPEVFRRSLEILATRGLVRRAGLRAYVINELGITASEHRSRLESVLPIPSEAAPEVGSIEIEGGVDFGALLEKLTFLAEPRLIEIIRRDLDELRGALERGHAKSAMLACGSVLEAILLDVVGRNPVVAKTYRRRLQFPDEFSLTDLIEVAINEDVLPPSVARMAGSITEHRDLIHPAAELRGDVKVNDARASMMVMFMQVVVTDLADPSTEAKIAAYVAK
jgi:hypothetical protein